MGFQFTYSGRNYVPTLTKDGRMELWGVASYGHAEHKGTFLLRIYALVKAPANAGSDKDYRNYRIVADEMRVPNTTSYDDQRALLNAMIHATAIKADMDFHLRHGHALRQPKGTHKGDSHGV